MTTFAVDVPRISDPFRHAHLFGAAGVLMALSLAVTLPAMALDPRLFQGESVWLKPVKFQIALTIYLLTLAVYARWMPAGLIDRLWWRVFAGIVVFCIAGEMACRSSGRRRGASGPRSLRRRSERPRLGGGRRPVAGLPRVPLDHARFPDLGAGRGAGTLRIPLRGNMAP